MTQLPPSQASSHFPLEPISASILADQEIQRRNAAVALGACKTGCAELDEYVLLGGFERGNVVGISAEDEEMGVQVSFLEGFEMKSGGFMGLELMVGSLRCRPSRTL